MRVYHGIHELPALPNLVITFGSFDGVHLGHQEIFRELATVAHSVSGTPLVQEKETPIPSAGPTYRRFHGSVRLDSLRIGRDAGRIADEVIQHLTRLIGSDVQVTLEIQARIEDGASEKTIRDITENCRTLRFDTFGFEEE